MFEGEGLKLALEVSSADLERVMRWYQSSGVEFGRALSTLVSGKLAKELSSVAQDS